MKIKLWGTRGSIPVSGPAFMKYGGNTNDDSRLILDAGTGIRELGESLTDEDLRKELFLIVTHSHWDHIQGFPFFKPLYRKGTKITIGGCPKVDVKLHQIFEHQMEKQFFPVELDSITAEVVFLDECIKDLKIGDAYIQALEVNHPILCHSVKIIEDGKSFVFMTDNEINQKNAKLDYKDMVAFVKDVDCLIIDTMYLDEEIEQKRGWGHSSISEVAKLAIDAQVKSLGLYHHDPVREDTMVDNIEAKCKKILKSNGLIIPCFATYDRQEIIGLGTEGYAKKTNRLTDQ
jgi:phosphoribosyl 1,2-cyclic phosphodiesterase